MSSRPRKSKKKAQEIRERCAMVEEAIDYAYRNLDFLTPENLPEMKKSIENLWIEIKNVPTCQEQMDLYWVRLYGFILQKESEFLQN